VLPGRLRVGFGEFAGGRQVAGDELRALFAQAPQVRENLAAEVMGVDPLQDLRPCVAVVLGADP
jgi:hypothetical protein